MTYKVNSWDEFQSLETVVLGSTYDSSFFNGIKNPKIADVLKKIVDETSEDLENFKSTLQSHNITVLQATPAELGYKSSILDYTDDIGRLGYQTENQELVRDHLIPIHPLQVRDDTVVMGNKLLVTDQTFEVAGYVEKFKEWFGEQNVDLSVYNGNMSFPRTFENLVEHYQTVYNTDISSWDTTRIDKLLNTDTLAGFCSPNITRIGKKCLVDNWQSPKVAEFLSTNYPMFEYEELTLGGHNDSIFCVLKPGLVIAGPWLKGKEGNFKDWDIVYFDDPNWDRVRSWISLREKNKGKWWVPGEEHNHEFTNFVESFLPHWTGLVEETIFDINCLSIDEKYVVTNSNNPVLIEQLKSKNLEPIYCPLRHRFFWDGGWHCLTLDVCRQGGQKDYKL